MVDPFDDRFDLIEPFCSLEDGVWYRARSQAGTPVEVAVFSDPDDGTKERLRALERARHPHLAELLEVVELEENRCAAVFAAAPGLTLRDRLERRDGTVKEAIDWGHRVAEALGVLHRSDLIHGDVEPGWIRLVEGRGPVLTGLELNRRRGRASGQGRGLSHTYPYAPPEQLRADPLSPASDLYSLAAVLFHALTGSPPLGNGELDALRERILAEKVPALARIRGDLRGVLGYALDRALSADSRRRFPDAEALRKALRSALVVAPRLGSLPLGEAPGSATPEAVSSPPPVPPETHAGTQKSSPSHQSDISELSDSDLEPISGSHPLVSGRPTPIDALDGPGTPPVGPTTVTPPDEARLDEDDPALDDGPTQVDGESAGPTGPRTEPAPPLFSDPSNQGAEPDLNRVGRKTGDYSARPPRERRGTASWRPPPASTSREATTTPRGVVGAPAEEELPREPTLRMVYGTDGVKPLAPASAVHEPAVVGEKAFGPLRTLPLATEINSPRNRHDPRREPGPDPDPSLEDQDPNDSTEARDTTPSDGPPPMEPDAEGAAEDARADPAIAPPPSVQLGEVSVPTLRIPRTKKTAPLGLFAATLLGGGALFAAGVGVGSLNTRQPSSEPTATAHAAPDIEGTEPIPAEPTNVPTPATPDWVADPPPTAVDSPTEGQTRPADEPHVLALDGLPPNAAITVDGVRIDGSEIPIEGEQHRVEIRAEGYEPWRTEIGRSESGTLVVRMQATPDEQLPEAEPRPTRTARRRSAGRRARTSSARPPTPSRAAIRRAARRRPPPPSTMRRPAVVRDPGF